MNNLPSTPSRVRPAHCAVSAAVLTGLLLMACSSTSTTTNPVGATDGDAGVQDDGGAAIVTLGAKQCTTFAGKTTAVAGATSGLGPALAIDGTVYQATLPGVSTGSNPNGTYHLFDGFFHITVPSAGTLYFFSNSTLSFSSASVEVGTTGAGPTGNLFCFATDWVDTNGNGPKATPCAFGCSAVQFAEAYQVTPGTYNVDISSGDMDGPINPAVNSATIRASFTFVPSN